MTNPSQPSSQANILVVDDSPGTLQVLVEMLTRLGHKVRPATSGRMALAAVEAEPPDLILLDIMMPEMNGFQVCEQLKAAEHSRDIPVIFISAISNIDDKIKAFSLGGVDYVTKPYQVQEVLARINTHLTLRDLQQNLERQNTELRQTKEAADRANRALSALNAVAFAANNSLDLEADLEKALEIVLQEMGLEYGWIFVPEDNGRLLRLVASIGLPDQFRQQEALTPVGRCTCGQRLRTAELHSRHKITECERLRPYPEQYAALTAQHISLPIFARQQQAVGLLNLAGKDIDDLTPEKYEWLEAVAQQISSAIENASLYQNQLGKAERLTVLNRVSSILSLSWQLERVLPPLLREMARLLEMSQGLVVIRSEEDRHMFEVRTRFGRWQSYTLLNAIAWYDVPVLQIIEQSLAPLLVLDAARDERLEPLSALIAQENIRTVLILPLVVQNQLTGFIQLHSIGRERFFEAAEIELARTLTNQAALAIEKARLYEATVARYEQELEIARQIQQNLLPRTEPEIPGLRVAGLCQPAYATGGDFYDYIVLPDRRLGIVVGDVTGKSLPAAMVMALARNTVRSELVNNPLPAEAVTTANHWLSRDIRPGTFVAVVQALIDSLARRLWLVNAGQTAALLVRDGQTEYLLPDEAVNLPLGVQPDAAFVQAQFALESGDTLLFYTDGIVEAQNAAGEMFGFERLEIAMQELQKDKEPAQIINDLQAKIQSFVGEAEQHDDITLVIVRMD